MAKLFDRPYGIAIVACEASSESQLCQQAIAASLRNRVNAGRFEPTIAGVCAQRYQYSETLPDKGDNANYERILNLPDADPQIVAAASAYDTVMANPDLDPSQRATHFFADGIPVPSWAAPPAILTVKIGRVSFYRGVA